jgi:peptidyl-tRNA hydrolase
MRRLFIIRKDLHLTPGKLAAMVAHCAEAYWTNLLKSSFKYDADPDCDWATDENKVVTVPRAIWDEYVSGIFTKTICEAKNLAQLEKAAAKAKELGFEEGCDWGYIRDCCLTELKPENEDGTCTVGIWFRPMDDDSAHAISKGFKLYGVFDRKRNCDVYRTHDEAVRAYAGGKDEIPDDCMDDFQRWLFAEYKPDGAAK